MDKKGEIFKLDLSENPTYQFINVFKNPNKLPINLIHIEINWREFRRKFPDNFEILSSSSKELESSYSENKSEVFPALDKRWLPKISLPKYFPYVLHEEDNELFITKNTLFIDALEYLLKCNYHQFWCTIFFEPSALSCIRSFILRPILPIQTKHLNDDYLAIYKIILNKFLLLFERLISFKQSDIEYMSESFGLTKLKEKKLLNLPIVITLVILYKDSKLDFVNKITDLYFNDTKEMDFLVKEVDTFVDQNLIIMEMIKGHLCGFDKNAVIVPISLEKRPAIFNLEWIFLVVDYLLITLITSNVLFRIYKPGIEMGFTKLFPQRLPNLYVDIYKELYELLDNRNEIFIQEKLFKTIIDEINSSRSEFIELFHTFVSSCLDDALNNIGNPVIQEEKVETYFGLLTVGLEEDYFICDYNATYNVAIQNEMFESCCDIDTTRTQFITSCINKLGRNHTLQELSKLKLQTVENIFKDFQSTLPEELEFVEPKAGTSREAEVKPNENETDEKIKIIIDMFPHLGDGFIFQCLEFYNFDSSAVINAILENNLPPYLTEIPFDSIRIPPEPEPEKPILAYRGKKPCYDDALKLLNDQTAKREMKNLVLEGIQYNYDNMYNDEYDDRDDDITIKVPDNPVSEELQTFNPNRNIKGKNDDESGEEDEESENEASNSYGKNPANFCEDPALLRERREAKFRSRNPAASSNQGIPKRDVVGKAKGQGQEKSTLLNRQKKNVNKSSRANHNRKSGAQWKRNKGMIPS